jgi:transcriptional regulator PpsR
MNPSPTEATGLGALADLAPELAQTFASIASDIALVIGSDGVIQNVAFGDAPMSGRADAWVGKSFLDAVTSDTRGKVQQLLDEVDHRGVSRRREVNLPGIDGLDIPVAFAAIRLGAQGPVLAVGRDLRAIAAIQQRFIDVQQELEREYWLQRQTESRYRLLFQVATDAVMVVDAATLTIAEANRAAGDLFDRAPDQLVGESASVGIDAGSQPAVNELLNLARASGRPAEMRARLACRPGKTISLSATPFRAAVQGKDSLLLLVRARSAESRTVDSGPLADFVEHTPDAVVISDSAGHVQMANPAFLNLCGAATHEQQLRGRLLSEVLGDPSRRLAALLADVRRLGIASQVRVPVGSFSAPIELEISAALLDEGDQVSIGFTFRRHASPAEGFLRPAADLAGSIEALYAQLGRVTLPELMQEVNHLAERHMVRSAMLRAKGHLGVAAEWLGLTPESLELRLQRHGLVFPIPGESSQSLLN